MRSPRIRSVTTALVFVLPLTAGAEPDRQRSQALLPEYYLLNMFATDQ